MNKITKVLAGILIITAITASKVQASVYNPNDLTTPSQATTQELYDMLYGTSYQTWSMAQKFKEVEEKYNVNAVFMIALTRVESGHGRNKLSDINNITSWKNSNNSWRAFKTKEECVECTAKLLHDKYLSPGGAYNNGKSIYNVNTCYCEEKPGEKHWANLINRVIKEINK